MQDCRAIIFRMKRGRPRGRSAAAHVPSIFRKLIGYNIVLVLVVGSIRLIAERLVAYSTALHAGNVHMVWQSLQATA